MLNWKVWKSCKELKKGHRKSKIEMEMELWKGRWSFWLGLHFRLWETVCGGHLHKVCFQSFALWLNMLYLFAGTTNLLAFRLRTLNTIPVTILSQLERPRTIKLTSFSWGVLTDRYLDSNWSTLTADWDWPQNISGIWNWLYIVCHICKFPHFYPSGHKKYFKTQTNTVSKCLTFVCIVWQTAPRIKGPVLSLSQVSGFCRSG